MLNNIIGYYAKVTDMALVNLKNEKKFQFGRYLKNNAITATVKDHYHKIHRSKQADKLVDDYVKAMNNMYKLAQSEYNTTLTKLKATNDPIAKQKILNDYANNGCHGFTAKNGARWNIETYSNMYSTHVNNELLRLREIENAKGNLFLISTHGTECDLCIPWEGRTVTRKQLDIARGEGLFHPRCMHFVSEVTA